ncbi:hypothetical protein A3D00_01510 [Candidatus Woesebacteria bacterium RIFCSPHIGHO2_02_FULL_38_9]|uniref:VanZ-like domain-containing protein n=2 Tax=Candidatus Roizmaniibacteriota TaxID=1752723 RepID=A0A1F7JRV8_9BACT|nr:MAG: hypothetical protein A2966_02255 [Candidatus Roizmanbacteria bacterium RIFCSPLOWO2_01_FULL_41_22]OGK58338.1 MAG: hypothetical protein A3H86_03205 [Candidatus Roizmanbacteria bacterium RIFCSPLOWO2_02_FULL_41_9]OGM32118.1 MAG: hypothetical protein A3D00_01510 [Candidatus Woesebacteria bacterium RIFCSPHIGHO2_02_FULL_38_9]
MLKKILVLVYYLGPILIWMSVIFYFSSKESVQVANSYVLNFIFFKFLHLTEYAILYFLVFRAFFYFSQKNLSLKQMMLLAIIITLLYAVSDEIHQLFVPTREGKIRDVLIDSLGILLSFVYTKKYFHLLQKFI